MTDRQRFEKNARTWGCTIHKATETELVWTVKTGAWTTYKTFNADGKLIASKTEMH